jgi:methionyl-tRNA synthetase
MADPYYITTAIHYPNGRPHIGHAYEMIAADAIARFQRQAGRDVRFQTGTDEHGLKMVQTARDLRDRCARASPTRCPSYVQARCATVLTSRTTASSAPPSPIIYRASQALWQAMRGCNGDLYLEPL